MKNLNIKSLLYCIGLLAVVATISSCRKIETVEIGGSENGLAEGRYEDGVLNATNMDDWHYYDAVGDRFVIINKADDYDTSPSTNTEDAFGNPITNALIYECYPHTDVKARADWDFAISRYKIRTNSGLSGVGSGGLYTFDANETFEAITALPAGAIFVEDARFGGVEMSGNERFEPRSEAQVTIMEGMPPTYHQPPIYAIRSADGQRAYAVDFISYQNSTGATGYVSFRVKQIDYTP